MIIFHKVAIRSAVTLVTKTAGKRRDIKAVFHKTAVSHKTVVSQDVRNSATVVKFAVIPFLMITARCKKVL